MTTIEECVAETVKQVLAEAMGDLTAKLDALQVRTAPAPQLLYREDEAAKMLGLAAGTLKKWRCQGRVKAHTPAKARLPLYSPENLQRIVEQLAAGQLGD